MWASNSKGIASEGLYTVIVGGGVTVRGKIVDDSGDPVAGVIVNACDRSCYMSGSPCWRPSVPKTRSRVRSATASLATS